MLNKKLQNPKRSGQDPTETIARFAAIEKEVAKLQEQVEILERDRRMRSGYHELGGGR